MLRTFSPINRLRELVEYLRAFQRQRDFEQRGEKLPANPTSFDRIRYCRSALAGGALPDAESLEFLLLAFDRYINSEGAFSLDESFKLISKPGVGNPSAIFSKVNQLNSALFEMAWKLAEDPQKIQEQAASEVSAKFSKEQKEALENRDLVREYRRHQFKRIENIIRNHHLSKPTG